MLLFINAGPGTKLFAWGRPPRPHLVGLDRHRLPSLVREFEARRQGDVGGRERERGDAEGDVQNNFLNQKQEIETGVERSDS